MSSNKNKEYKNCDDLKFIPFTMDNLLCNTNFMPTSLQYGVPMNNNMNNTMYNNMNNNMNNNINSPFIGIPPLYLTNMNNTENSSTNLNQKKNITTPLTPYPNNITTLTEDDFTNNNSNLSNTSIEDEYPSEDLEDELYSYNTDNSQDTKDDINRNYINPIDIVRNFDFSIEADIVRNDYTNKDIDDIFENIKENNSSVLSALKAYRIPYPIAVLVVKKVIKSTLDYYKK